MWFVVFPADSAGLLQFEVCPLTDSSFSVSFQHPVNESLVCGEFTCFWNLYYYCIFDVRIYFLIVYFCPTRLPVVMEVIDSRQVSCRLYKGPSDALICTDDFITKVVQRCVSGLSVFHSDFFYWFEKIIDIVCPLLDACPFL